jgi:biotin operon repressor
MRRADRLFQIVGLLGRRRFMTAAQLAETLEVSTRTIYRDVLDLIASGVPILGEAGVGYQLSPSYRLPPMTFTADEIEALVLGTRMVEAWGDASLRQAARSIFDKVDAVVGDSEREQLSGSALFSLRFGVQREASQHLGELRQAINRRQRIRFRYQSEQGGHRARRASAGTLLLGTRLDAGCLLRAAHRFPQLPLGPHGADRALGQLRARPPVHARGLRARHGGTRPGGIGASGGTVARRSEGRALVLCWPGAASGGTLLRMLRLPGLSLCLCLAGCGASGQAWVHGVADPGSPSASREGSALPVEPMAPSQGDGAQAPVRKPVMTLGERTEVPDDEHDGNVGSEGSPPAISYVPNHYYPNYGHGYGGYGYGYGGALWAGGGFRPDRPDHNPDPHPEPHERETPRMGGSWSAPPSYGPPMMTQTLPADPWR